MPRRTHVVPVALAAATALLAPVAAFPAPGAAAATPVHTERVVIGTSVQGRPIVAWHRWRDGAHRRVVVVGSIHGDERAGIRVVTDLRRRKTLPANLDLWLVRSVNPDGNAADRRTNAHGVDLNRNFPRFWRRSGRGTTKWSGPRRASEPETRALMAFVRTVRPRTTLVVHQPLFGIDRYRAKSLWLVRALSRATGLPVKSFDCYGGCHGTFTDWNNHTQPGRGVTVELGHRASAWRVRHVASAVISVGSTH